MINKEIEKKDFEMIYLYSSLENSCKILHESFIINLNDALI
jgi:hypothetical protein